MRTRIAWLSASGSEAAGVDGRAKVGGGVHGGHLTWSSFISRQRSVIHATHASRVCVYTASLVGRCPRETCFTPDFAAMMHANALQIDPTRSILHKVVVRPRYWRKPDLSPRVHTFERSLYFFFWACYRFLDEDFNNNFDFLLWIFRGLSWIYFIQSKGGK